jgi:hypothetical protein
MAANLLIRSGFAMINLVLFSLLVGAVLGIRLKVLVLVPAIGFFVIAIAGIGVARGDAFSTIASAIALTVVAIQLGYLGGSATRFVLVAARVSRRYKIHSPAPRHIQS